VYSKLARTPIAGAVAAFALSACAVWKSIDTPPPPRKFEGQWQGVLTRGAIPGDSEPWQWKRDFEVKISVSKQTVQVHVLVDGRWREIKPGRFGITWLDTNAIISSISTGTMGDSVWVETWSFVATRLDGRRLEVSFHQQVNNKDVLRSHPSAAWGRIAFGTLERISD
jgi:hypothetical protein